MVKADIKRDYYADLNLPPTADSEDVKKQFRLLAKLYHPDRNPGHETEVVPKFQAVQAAHEILIDPVEKKKYDEGRAKLAAKAAQPNQGPANNASGYSADPYGFPRPPHPKPPGSAPQFGFPPPPKPKDKRSPFPPPNSKPSSTGAEKFSTWTRAAPIPNPNTWDRSRYDAAASAEAARGFSNMRQTQSNPQVPPRPNRQHPTAPRPPSTTDNTQMPNGMPGGFPGLSRTQSARKTPGYNTAAYGNDELPAQRSAYSYVRGDRPPQVPPNIHVPDSQNTRTPPVTRSRPAVSPLRHTRSSDYEMRSNAPGMSRPSAKYATTGGEKTSLHGDGIRRSSSVRNSPVDPQWEEEDRGAFGRPLSSRHEHLPRHRSASPKVAWDSRRPISASSSSESEDDVVKMYNRPKATPKSRPKPTTTPSYQAFAADNPALTGQFPSTNYTKIVNEGQHDYPPPEPREHTRKPWSNIASPDVESPAFGFGGHGTDGPKYASPPFPAHWPYLPGVKRFQRGYSLNGIPVWAIPSSVFPQMTSPSTVLPKHTDAYTHMRFSIFHTPRPSTPGDPFTDFNTSNDARAAQPHPKTPFVASEWHDKVTTNNFQPNDPHIRRSPSKMNRTSGKPVTRGRGLSRAADGDFTSSSESSVSAHREHRDSKTSEETHSKADAFQPGKLPQDWASRTRQAEKPDSRGGDDATHVNSREPTYVVIEEDVEPMDIDETPPSNGNKPRSTNGTYRTSTAEPSQRSSKRTSMNGVDLREFTQHAPFAPNANGLKDLDDIGASLPFESRAEEQLPLDRKTSNIKRPLDMPRPPRTVEAPSEDRLTEENFLRYTRNMSAYMLEWNNFNARMLEHFRHRQDQVCGHMSTNWITMKSDGPDAHEAAEQLENSSITAGYATYMQWLEDDAKCRMWWDDANDKHYASLKELGRIREKAKRSLRK